MARAFSQKSSCISCGSLGFGFVLIFTVFVGISCPIDPRACGKKDRVGEEKSSKSNFNVVKGGQGAENEAKTREAFKRNIIEGNNLSTLHLLSPFLCPSPTTTL